MAALEGELPQMQEAPKHHHSVLHQMSPDTHSKKRKLDKVER